MLEHFAPMITAIFGIYNPHTRELTYTLAGHPPALLLHDDGSITVLNGSGPPLGIAFDEVFLDDHRLALPEGATLVCFTDGLIEYGRDVLLAERRLHDVLRRRTFLSEPNPAQAVIDAVLDAPQRDDIAVLVMRT
jgi:serine phosphatase RsbU (regulator of sigma subunit)